MTLLIIQKAKEEEEEEDEERDRQRKGQTDKRMSKEIVHEKEQRRCILKWTYKMYEQDVNISLYILKLRNK